MMSTTTDASTKMEGDRHKAALDIASTLVCAQVKLTRIHIATVFTRLQAPSELTPTSSRGLDMKEKSAIKRLSRIEAWSTN